jgi:hypothetical protein
MKGYRIAWFLLGILIALVVVPAFGATIADYPEADIWTALDAPKSQKIWNQPGNLVAKAMVQPIVRFTLSLYDDQYNENGARSGFLTLTHVATDGIPTTFYYNIRQFEMNNAVIGFVPEAAPMMEEGYRGIVPSQKVPAGFEAVSNPAKLLQLLIPQLGGIARDEDNNIFLVLVLGNGPGLSGSVKLPVSNLVTFTNRQRGRTTQIWAGEVGVPAIVKWSGKNDDGTKGEYEWRPDLDEPLFSPELRYF